MVNNYLRIEYINGKNEIENIFRNLDLVVSKPFIDEFYLHQITKTNQAIVIGSLVSYLDDPYVIFEKLSKLNLTGLYAFDYWSDSEKYIEEHGRDKIQWFLNDKENKMKSEHDAFQRSLDIQHSAWCLIGQIKAMDSWPMQSVQDTSIQYLERALEIMKAQRDGKPTDEL